MGGYIGALFVLVVSRQIILQKENDRLNISLAGELKERTDAQKAVQLLNAELEQRVPEPYPVVA